MLKNQTAGRLTPVQQILAALVTLPGFLTLLFPKAALGAIGRIVTSDPSVTTQVVVIFAVFLLIVLTGIVFMNNGKNN